MLFTLHESIAAELTADHPEIDSAVEGLENLAQARREGRHMIFGARSTLESIIASGALSQRATATYEVVYGRLAEKRTFANLALRRVEVVANGYGPLSFRTVAAKSVIQVPVGGIDSELVQRTLLIGENLVDVDIYVRIAQIAAHRARVGSIPVSFEPVGGGGSTVADQYDRYQSAATRLCLCIVDSDRKAPSGRVGETAQRVQRINTDNRPLSEALVLRVRELENLIPLRIYSQLQGIDANALARLERIAASSISEIGGYLDVKLGTSLKWAMSFAAGTPEHAYWLALLPQLARELHDLARDCINNRECNSPASCQCVISTGLGVGVLNHACRRLQETSPQKISESIDQALAEEWSRLGEVILAWCCGSPALRAA